MLGPTQNPISLGIMESVGLAVTDKAHSVAGVLTPTACHIKRLIKFDSFICTYRIDKRGCSLKQMEGKGWGKDGRLRGEGRVCAVLGGRMAPGRRWGRAMVIGARGCQGGCCQEQSLLQHPRRRGRGQGETGEFQVKGVGSGDLHLSGSHWGAPQPLLGGSGPRGYNWSQEAGPGAGESRVTGCDAGMWASTWEAHLSSEPRAEACGWPPALTS